MDFGEVRDSSSIRSLALVRRFNEHAIEPKKHPKQWRDIGIGNTPPSQPAGFFESIGYCSDTWLVTSVVGKKVGSAWVKKVCKIAIIAITISRHQAIIEWWWNIYDLNVKWKPTIWIIIREASGFWFVVRDQHRCCDMAVVTPVDKLSGQSHVGQISQRDNRPTIVNHRRPI